MTNYIDKVTRLVVAPPAVFNDVVFRVGVVESREGRQLGFFGDDAPCLMKVRRYIEIGSGPGLGRDVVSFVRSKSQVARARIF